MKRKITTEVNAFMSYKNTFNEPVSLHRIKDSLYLDYPNDKQLRDGVIKELYTINYFNQKVQRYK